MISLQNRDKRKLIPEPLCKLFCQTPTTAPKKLGYFFRQALTIDPKKLWETPTNFEDPNCIK